MEDIIQEIMEEILSRLSTPFRKIRVEKLDEKTWRVNIESEEPSLLIGYHGENIAALQHIAKTILWKKAEVGGQEKYNVVVDVDDYRKRQEENVIKMAERKVDMVRKNRLPQSLPAMSPYFRRVIHLHLAEKYPDIITESSGEGDFRHIMIKPKS